MPTLAITTSPTSIPATAGNFLVLSNAGPSTLYVSAVDSSVVADSLFPTGIPPEGSRNILVPSSGLWAFGSASGSMEYVDRPSRSGASGPGGTASVSSIPDILIPATPVTEWTDTFDGSALNARWTAALPAQVAVAGGVFTHTNVANGFALNSVAASDVVTDGVFEIEVVAGSGTGVGAGICARKQATGYASYFTEINSGGEIKIYVLSGGGAPSAISASSLNGFDPNTGYRHRVSVYGISPTLILAEIFDTGGSRVAAVHAVSASAEQQAPGKFGTVAWASALQIASARFDAQPLPAPRKGIVMGIVGDSIYAGFNVASGEPGSSGALEAEALASITGIPVSRLNVAVNSTTTAHWATNTGGANLTTAITNFKNAGVNVVVVGLGTNDSSTDNAITTAQYLANLQTICTALFAGVPGLQAVILHAPPSHVYGGTLGGQSIAKILEYTRALPSICTGSNGRGILLGDCESFGYFVGNPSQLGDGLHPGPDTVGSTALGRMRARKVAKVLGL